MTSKRSKRRKRKKGIVESIRKPTAPPSRRFSSVAKANKRRPSGRDDKHKGNKDERFDD